LEVQPLPLYLLETLLAFSEQVTLQETARKLQISQPAVSKQLQRLEELAPFPLFINVGRKKTLTTYGAQLADSAKQHLESLSRDIMNTNVSYGDGQGVQLKVAGRLEFLVRYLGNIQNFKGTLEYIDRSSSDLIADLLGKKIDLAISHKTNTKLEYIQKKIGIDRASLIIPKSWKVPTEPGTFLQNASNWPTAIYSREMFETEMTPSMRKKMPHLDIKMIIPDWLQIEEWVREQKVWAIVPHLFAQNDSDYDCLELDELFSMHDYYIYYRPDLSKLSWFQAILQQLPLAK
jgi:DNA-binding transcriptional LysR family regulator